MTKKYFYIALLTCLFSLAAAAQEGKASVSGGKEPIEGLNIYPNPAKADRIYITTSKPGVSKEVEIFNISGRKVMQLTLNVGAKEINISNLATGIYMIKIKEGDNFTVRKLVVE